MSELRCRVGDLAYIVAPGRPADGFIVKCVRFLGTAPSIGVDGIQVSARWRLDRYVPAFNGVPTNSCPDSQLRPIRPSDEPDEILTLAGKPQEVAA